MSLTDVFQRDVSYKLSQYLEKKINNLRELDHNMYDLIRREYEYQLGVIQQTRHNHNINFKATDFHSNWLSCLAEPITEYNLGDLTHTTDDDYKDIYSPRIDIAITPTVIRKKSRKISMGVYRLATKVQLFELIHRLDFILEIESRLRSISNNNLKEFKLEPQEDIIYTNTRPMHLFGIEIENQKNPKHLMGDFLNAISLSKIPIIVFPEDKFIGCIKMLLFSSTIRGLKEVPIYNILNKAIILKVGQFRDAMNTILAREGIDLIETNNYG